MSVVNKYFLKKDVVIVFIIIFLPFIFFTYNIVPETREWRTKFFTIDSGSYYNSAQYFIWFISIKFMTLILLSLWFITSCYKWRYILLFPIFMELFKINSILKSLELGTDYITNAEEILIICIPYLTIIMVMSNYFKRYKSSKKINENVNDEINNFLIRLSKFDVKYYKSIRKEFIELKKNKENIDKREYLVKLIKLRDQMTI